MLVVSDASQDGTDELVRRFAETSTIPVQLISNCARAGKSSAINQGLAHLGKIDIVVMISGDVLPGADCIPRLVAAFADPSVGVAGGRPNPVGPRDNLASEITRFMWALHHVISLRFPKTTEITCFRNVIPGINCTSLVDEAAIEQELRCAGYVVRYIPEARIVSPTPLRFSDYIKQRTSVTLGYLRLRRREGHVMATSRLGERLRALATILRTEDFRLTTIFCAISAEIFIRVFAWMQFLARLHRGGIWGRSDSTKRALALQPSPSSS